MRLLIRMAIAALSLLSASSPSTAQDFVGGLPRSETLIIQGVAAQNADWFNVWVPGGGSNTNGLQQLSTDTLWFINPEGGPDAWQNAVAEQKPVYSDDFTEMTVKLRRGLYWSDGVEFTGDDLAYTVQTQIDHPGMAWSAPFKVNVAGISQPDRDTVVFKLRAPNSRFHTLFTVRWNAAWIMPKHVFEKVADPLTFSNNPPVSLGPYVLHANDPNGKWVIWERRADWQRSSLGMTMGMPTPKYVVYRAVNSPDARVIEQRSHNLDVINDLAPEGMFAIMRDPKASATAFRTKFPFAHPDPTLPSVIFNTQVKPLDNKDVRWALALAIDIREVALGAYRGAATVAALAIPPTGEAVDDYVRPLQPFLLAYELDTGRRKIHPYDPAIGSQLANLVRPAWKDQITTDPAELQTSFGFGWWRQDRAAAGELLQKSGFHKQGDRWIGPDGKPLALRLQVEGDAIPTLARAGSVIAQQWRQFGVDVRLEVAGPTHTQRMSVGDFDAVIHWTIETWGGHPDLSYFLESYHSAYIAQPGKPQPPRNFQRWQDLALDAIIEANRSVPFDSPDVIRLGRAFLELAVREMPFIPLMAYNKFAPFDTTWWTGYPTAQDPYAASGPYWSNIRYMLVRLKPAAH